jgi:hypothetical protein
MNYQLGVYAVLLSSLLYNFRDNIVVFIENLIQKKENIKYVLIESHGYSDISVVSEKCLYRF